MNLIRIGAAHLVVVGPGPVLTGRYSQKPTRRECDGIAEVKPLLMNAAGDVEAVLTGVGCVAGIGIDLRISDVGIADGGSVQRAQERTRERSFGAAR